MTNKRLAFTLAEVLITLGVIGVVAAMTMPMLLAKYQKTQTVNQFKKAYAELTQAIKISEAKYGTSEDWDFADFETSQERMTYFAENYLFPNIKVLKKCLPSTNECWADDVYSINGVKNALLANTSSGRGSFITASGYSVLFWMHGVGTGGWFYIDINGPKKPNTLGKDIFTLIFINKSSYNEINNVYYKQGLNPMGLSVKSGVTRENLINAVMPWLVTDYANGRSACKKDSTNTSIYAGVLCGDLIILDGWEIKDDYPW